MKTIFLLVAATLLFAACDKIEYRPSGIDSDLKVKINITKGIQNLVYDGKDVECANGIVEGKDFRFITCQNQYSPLPGYFIIAVTDEGETLYSFNSSTGNYIREISRADAVDVMVVPTGREGNTFFAVQTRDGKKWIGDAGPYEEIYPTWDGYTFKKDGLYGWANYHCDEVFPAKCTERMLVIGLRRLLIFVPKSKGTYTVYERVDYDRFVKKCIATQKEVDTIYDCSDVKVSEYSCRTWITDIPGSLANKYW